MKLFSNCVVVLSAIPLVVGMVLAVGVLCLGAALVLAARRVGQFVSA